MSESELFEMRKTIRLTLIKMGFRCDLLGYAYLCYAIEQSILNPELLNNLCNQLYVMTGKEYNVKEHRSVERSIRHSIESTFDNNSFEVLNTIFNGSVMAPDERPTAGQLIKLMTEYYNLGIYKTYLNSIKK